MDLFEKRVLDALRLVTNPVSLSSGYPAAACFKNLNLVEIPDVMDKKGFTVAAALMRRWFLGKAFAMPTRWKDAKTNGFDHRTLASPYLDTSIVTMQWALKYGRTGTAKQEVKNAALGLLSPISLKASQNELSLRLEAAGKFTDKSTTFGRGLSATADIHHTAHINSRSVSTNQRSKLSDPLDDLYCALGAFTLHVAGAGTVTPLKPAVGSLSPTHRVKIDALGFYLRDCYDFNDDQPLGNWGPDGVAMLPSSRLVMVENESFRKWRKRHNRGGDFIIFSDVRWEALPQALTWDYTIR